MERSKQLCGLAAVATKTLDKFTCTNYSSMNKNTIKLIQIQDDKK